MIYRRKIEQGAKDLKEILDQNGFFILDQIGINEDTCFFDIIHKATKTKLLLKYTIDYNLHKQEQSTLKQQELEQQISKSHSKLFLQSLGNNEDNIIIYEGFYCNLQEYCDMMILQKRWWFHSHEELNFIVWKLITHMLHLSDQKIHFCDLSPYTIVFHLDQLSELHFLFYDQNRSLVIDQTQTIIGYRRLYNLIEETEELEKRIFTDKSRKEYDFYQLGRIIQKILIKSVEAYENATMDEMGEFNNYSKYKIPYENNKAAIQKSLEILSDYYDSALISLLKAMLIDKNAFELISKFKSFLNCSRIPLQYFKNDIIRQILVEKLNKQFSARKLELNQRIQLLFELDMYDLALQIINSEIKTKQFTIDQNPQLFAYKFRIYNHLGNVDLLDHDLKMNKSKFPFLKQKNPSEYLSILLECSRIQDFFFDYLSVQNIEFSFFVNEIKTQFASSTPEYFEKLLQLIRIFRSKCGPQYEGILVPKIKDPENITQLAVLKTLLKDIMLKIRLCHNIEHYLEHFAFLIVEAQFYTIQSFDKKKFERVNKGGADCQLVQLLESIWSNNNSKNSKIQLILEAYQIYIETKELINLKVFNYFHENYKKINELFQRCLHFQNQLNHFSIYHGHYGKQFLFMLEVSSYFPSLVLVACKYSRNQVIEMKDYRIQNYKSFFQINHSQILLILHNSEINLELRYPIDDFTLTQKILIKKIKNKQNQQNDQNQLNQENQDSQTNLKKQKNQDQIQEEQKNSSNIDLTEQSDSKDQIKDNNFRVETLSDEENRLENEMQDEQMDFEAKEQQILEQSSSEASQKSEKIIVIKDFDQEVLEETEQTTNFHQQQIKEIFHHYFQIYKVKKDELFESYWQEVEYSDNFFDFKEALFNLQLIENLNHILHSEAAEKESFEKINFKIKEVTSNIQLKYELKAYNSTGNFKKFINQIRFCLQIYQNNKTQYFIYAFELALQCYKLEDSVQALFILEDLRNRQYTGYLQQKILIHWVLFHLYSKTSCFYHNDVANDINICFLRILELFSETFPRQNYFKSFCFQKCLLYIQSIITKDILTEEQLEIYFQISKLYDNFDQFNCLQMISNIETKAKFQKNILQEYKQTQNSRQQFQDRQHGILQDQKQRNVYEKAIRENDYDLIFQQNLEEMHPLQKMLLHEQNVKNKDQIREQKLRQIEEQKRNLQKQKVNLNQMQFQQYFKKNMALKFKDIQKNPELTCENKQYFINIINEYPNLSKNCDFSEDFYNILTSKKLKNKFDVKEFKELYDILQIDKKFEQQTLQTDTINFIIEKILKKQVQTEINSSSIFQKEQIQQQTIALEGDIIEQVNLVQSKIYQKQDSITFQKNLNDSFKQSQEISKSQADITKTLTGLKTKLFFKRYDFRDFQINQLPKIIAERIRTQEQEDINIYGPAISMFLDRKK